MDDDRQLRELHDRERWELGRWLDRTIDRMERDVGQGSTLQKLIRAERLAANTDTNEQERTDGHHCERQGRG